MFNFSFGFDIYEAVFEIYIENTMVKKQTMQAPKEILIANFMQTAKQIKNDKKPMKIKMIVPNVIWDDFDNKEKVLYNEAIASNSSMIEWEESAKENA